MGKITIFDVDHTLVRRSTGEYFLLSAVRHGVLPWSILLQVPLFLIKYRYGALENDLINKGVGPLRGLSISRLQEIAQYSFERHVKKALFYEMKELVQKLIDTGELVVLATSSIDFIVSPLADYLGVSEIIASKLEVENGLCTGRFTDAAVFGKEKLIKVERYLKENGFSLQEASFYSDSFHDVPLLEKVGNPVVVNPDYRLQNMAKKKNWSMLYCNNGVKP